MPYITGIPDYIRDFNLSMTIEPGAYTRGSINFNPFAPMAHHTGAANDITRMLRDGRPGLSGPLCNVELRKNGHCHVIACGRANHAGAGSWRGLSGNSRFIGIEATSNGTYWTPIQREIYPILCAALAKGLHRDASWICDHKAYAGYRGKWDLGNWDMNSMRHHAAIALENHKHGKVEEDMAGAYAIVIPKSTTRSINIPGGGVPGKVAVTFHCDFDTPTLRLARWHGGALRGIWEHKMIVKKGREGVVWFDASDPGQWGAVLGVTNRSTKADVTALVEYGIR